MQYATLLFSRLQQNRCCDLSRTCITTYQALNRATLKQDQELNKLGYQKKGSLNPTFYFNLQSYNGIVSWGTLRPPTLEGPVLRCAGVDEVEGHVGRAADVLVGEGAGGALVAAAHQALAHKVHDDHKHQQDDGDDRADGGGAGGEVAGQRGQELCSC